MRSANPFLPLLLLPLALLACDVDVEEDADAEGAATMDAAAPPMATLTELTAIRDAWVAAALAGDAAGVGNLYTSDAHMVGPDGERVDGAAAIQESLAPSFEMLTALEVTSLDQVLGQDMMSDMGTFRQTLQTPEGEQVVEGYYVVVLHRDGDGSWKIAHHLSAALPQAPAM